MHSLLYWQYGDSSETVRLEFLFLNNNGVIFNNNTDSQNETFFVANSKPRNFERTKVLIPKNIKI